jgi:sugar/nucleoside kinase (ribokinase family)
MAKPSQANVCKIAGIGLIALDLLIKCEKDTPTVSAGGTCGNVLAILAMLGWKSQAIGRLFQDAGAELISEDLKAWGVDTELLNLSPSAPAPMIVERLRLDSAGIPFHSFAFACPWCGERLPSYQPVTIASVRAAAPKILQSDVLFVDRASPGAVELATMFNSAGKIVVFEPSSSKVDHLLQKLLSVSHIVKYSHERFEELEEISWPRVRKLEIQTLGRGGLRFRMSAKNKVTLWQHLHAPKRETIVDTCGAGDWATAGLIELTCKNGLAGVANLSKERILRALTFAQKLGSWNCGYPGARGAMYSVSKPALLKEVKRLAHPSVLTMPTTEGPSVTTNAAPGACRLCSEMEIPAKRRGIL